MATLNVWNTSGDWDRRREVLRAGFATMAPDLVTLQETIVTDGYDQATDILGDGYHVVHQRAREPNGQSGLVTDIVQAELMALHRRFGTRGYDAA